MTKSGMTYPIIQANILDKQKIINGGSRSWVLCLYISALFLLDTKSCLYDIKLVLLLIVLLYIFSYFKGVKSVPMHLKTKINQGV